MPNEMDASTFLSPPDEAPSIWYLDSTMPSHENEASSAKSNLLVALDLHRRVDRHERVDFRNVAEWPRNEEVVQVAREGKVLCRNTARYGMRPAAGKEYARKAPCSRKYSWPSIDCTQM
jgi:hypothetical protein